MATNDDSRYRVAYDLASRIYNAEKTENGERLSKLTEDEAREYWFKLYAQSLRIVNGELVSQVLPKPKQ